MAVGRAGRGLTGPLLTVNLVVYLIILGLSGWSLDKYIDGEQNHPHLGGNPSTTFMLIFALIAGVIGACSVLSGFMHFLAWRSDSLASAASLSIISWAITALAFGSRFGPNYCSGGGGHGHYGGIGMGHESQKTSTPPVV